jgi:hypothetical protein
MVTGMDSFLLGNSNDCGDVERRSQGQRVQCTALSLRVKQKLNKVYCLSKFLAICLKG